MLIWTKRISAFLGKLIPYSLATQHKVQSVIYCVSITFREFFRLA